MGHNPVLTILNKTIIHWKESAEECKALRVEEIQKRITISRINETEAMTYMKVQRKHRIYR